MNEKGRIPGRLSKSCRKTSEKEKKEEKSYTLDKIMWEMLKDKGEMRLG